MTALDRDRIASALPAYDVGDELGRGAFGRVFAGQHRQLGRPVAIKQLATAFAADPDVRGRFLAEAQLLAGLEHTHVVPVYDYVEDENLCLLVMEKLSGGTVWQRFRTGRVGAETACALTLAAAAGLHHAHEHGVLHRDVKPDNLMFSGAGTLKVTDFGIAKVVSGAKTSITRAGEVIGTPSYMAPEQARGEQLGPYTDVYALGTVLYQLLAGRLPYPEDGTVMDVMYRHVHEEPTPIGDVADIPHPLGDVVMRCLTRDMGERYGSTHDLGLALAEATVRAWGPDWLSRAEARESPAVQGLLQRAMTTPHTSTARVTSAGTSRPAPEPRRRNRALVPIAAVLLGIAVVVAVAVVATRGGDDTQDRGQQAAVTTSAPASAPLPPERVLADSVIAAWRAGDRIAAGQLAPTPVVEQLFATPAGAAPRFIACEPVSSDEVDCSYGLPGRALVVRMFRDADSGYTVTQAVFVND